MPAGKGKPGWWPCRAACLKLPEKGAHGGLAEQEAAYLLVGHGQAGNHPDPGPPALSRMAEDIHRDNPQGGEFFLKLGKRPAGQMTARSEPAVVKEDGFHGGVIF
jgi:hypothetical protein